MDSRTFNDSGSPTLLFVMGLGNRFDGASVRWFLDQLTRAGYRVHALRLPIEITDFERDYRLPVQRAHDEQDPAGVVGHSLGGLVAAFLETSAEMVYLSPWWGIHESKVSTIERWLVPKLPLQAPILPVDTDRDELGVHLSDGEWEQVPNRLSPAYITTIYRAQRTRPDISDDAVVFVSLTDSIISPTAIGKAVRAEQVRLYDGEHQLFAASERKQEMERLLAELPGAGQNRATTGRRKR